MNLRTSRILRELRAGKRPTCFKLNLGDPRVIELCGLAGASAVWICNEHVSNDWFNLENQIRAAKLYDVDTIVRVAKGSYSDYVKPFEADATAIMVPHVKNAEETRQVVEMTRFHPVGRPARDGGIPAGRTVRSLWPTTSSIVTPSACSSFKSNPLRRCRMSKRLPRFRASRSFSLARGTSATSSARQDKPEPRRGWVPASGAQPPRKSTGNT